MQLKGIYYRYFKSAIFKIILIPSSIHSLLTSRKSFERYLASLYWRKDGLSLPTGKKGTFKDWFWSPSNNTTAFGGAKYHKNLDTLTKRFQLILPMLLSRGKIFFSNLQDCSIWGNNIRSEQDQSTHSLRERTGFLLQPS